LTYDFSYFLTYNFDNFTFASRTEEPILKSIYEILKAFAFLIAEIKGLRWYEVPPKTIAEISSDIENINNILSDLGVDTENNYLLSFENFRGDNNPINSHSFLKLRGSITLNEDETWNWKNVIGFPSSNSDYAVIDLNGFSIQFGNNSKISNIKFSNGVIKIDGSVKFENCYFDDDVEFQGLDITNSEVHIRNSYINFPTERIRFSNLKVLDIQGSYVIIPSTNSPLIQNVNYVIFNSNTKSGYSISSFQDLLDTFQNAIDISYSGNLEV